MLVTQIRLDKDEWLYIASLLPEPYTSLETERLPRQQIGFIALTTALLLLFIGLLVHWQSRPLKRLARAAREMSLAPMSRQSLKVGAAKWQKWGGPSTACASASVAT